jgi:hypothetical protein
MPDFKLLEVQEKKEKKKITQVLYLVFSKHGPWGFVGQ